MINKLLKETIITKFGEDVWQKAAAKAKLDIDYFVEMSAYPDHITYELVGAVCEITGVNVDDFLHQFGRIWISHTYDSAYRHYYKSKSNLQDMIENLNAMHADLGLVLPELSPPSFHVVEKSLGHCVVDYVSERPGLVPFVSGLLKGLGDVYKTPINVELLETPKEVTQRFQIKYC